MVSLCQVRTHQNYSTTLKMIAAQMKDPPATTGSLTVNLKNAQRDIWEIKQAAAQKREDYLQELLDAAQHTNDKNRQKLIMHLRMAKYNRKCFNLH